MNKIKILRLFFCLTAVVSIDLEAQDNLEDRIRKMLEMTLEKEQFHTAIDEIITLFQQNNYDGEVSANFFDSYRKKAKEEGFDKMIDGIVQVYQNHLTTEEIEGIIKFQESEGSFKFYETEVGKSFLEKKPEIAAKSKEIGLEWGEQLGEEILKEMDVLFMEKGPLENERNFNAVIEEDCSRFKKGNFVSYYHDGTEIKYKRTKRIQTEVRGNKTPTKLKIEWLSNNRYSLIRVKEVDDIFYGKKLICNIYEVTETGYKIVSKFEDMDNKFDYVELRIVK